MGLSVSAATAIILIAMVVNLSFFGMALFDTFDRIRFAGELRFQMLSGRERTCISVRDVNHTAPDLDIFVANCGSMTLRANEMSVLLDGVLTPSSNVTWDVGGVSTDLVHHGETLRLRITPVASTPSSIKVVTGNGVQAYW